MQHRSALPFFGKPSKDRRIRFFHPGAPGFAPLEVFCFFRTITRDGRPAR